MVSFCTALSRKNSDAQVGSAFGENTNVMGAGIALVTGPVMMGVMSPLGAAARTALRDTFDVQVADASGKNTNAMETTTVQMDPMRQIVDNISRYRCWHLTRFVE